MAQERQGIYTEILNVLFQEKGPLKPEEIERRLPETYRLELNKPLPSLSPTAKTSILYYMRKLEERGLVNCYDESGAERQGYINTTKRFYELTEKGRIVSVPPKNAKELADKMAVLLDMKVNEQFPFSPLKAHKLWTQFIKENPELVFMIPEEAHEILKRYKKEKFEI